MPTSATQSLNDTSVNDALPAAVQQLAEEMDKDAHKAGTLTCKYKGMVANLLANPGMFQGVVNPDSKLYVDSRMEQANLAIQALKMSKTCNQSLKFFSEVMPLVWRLCNKNQLYHVVNEICDAEDLRIMLQQIRDLGDAAWASALMCNIYDALSCDVYLSSITGGLSGATWDVLEPTDVMNLIIATCVHYQDDGFKVLNHAIDNGCLCPVNDEHEIRRIVEAIAKNIETVPESMWKYMTQAKVKQALITHAVAYTTEGHVARGDDEISFEPWKHLRPESMKELVEETLSSKTKKQLLTRAVDYNVFNHFTVEDTSNLMHSLIETHFLNTEDFPDELWRKGNVEDILTKPDHLGSKQDAFDAFMHAHALGCVDASSGWVKRFIRHVTTRSDEATFELFEPCVHPCRFPMEILEHHRDLLFNFWSSHNLDSIISELTPGDDIMNIEHVFHAWKTPNYHLFHTWMRTRVTTKQIVQYLLDQAEEIIKTFRLMQQIQRSLSREGIVKITERHTEIEMFAQDILRCKVTACNADKNTIWNQ